VNTVTGPPLERPGAAAYHRMFARPLHPKIFTCGQRKDDAAKIKVEACSARIADPGTAMMTTIARLWTKTGGSACEGGLGTSKRPFESARKRSLQ
jgi:hypothetical protein